MDLFLLPFINMTAAAQDVYVLHCLLPTGGEG